MNCATSPEQDYNEFVEVDPTGRYGRYNEVLGKGASKTVYRAFDEFEGIEVAWNQVKLYDFLHNPEDIERLYCEIHLLKTLNHKNIMKFYSSWVDTASRNINFVTEMFTSGTLRQYRLKHKRVNIRAVKHWCRQILNGLLYLHSHDPPVIHRDLKCDNIFINGNNGEVKVGDLGLAAILRKSHAVCCVGTPEFMAPEVYEEEYNELVDIYSFGMCVLEMVTFEYPYSECNHPAQIYKKVTSGKKPEALYNVKDPEVRQFVEKCLATVSLRLPARELLRDPFLLYDDYCYDLRPVQYQNYFDEVSTSIRQPYYKTYNSNKSSINGYTNYLGYENGDDLDYHPIEHETSEIDLFNCQEDESFEDVDITIKGRRKDDDDDDIFLRLRIADKEGCIRNIYFPFDIGSDTAWSVATEMVDELDITDQDVTKIADMIDAEIATLVPEWKKGSLIEENHHSSSENSCQICAANDSLLDYVAQDNPCANLQVLQCCSKQGCATIHGRFEEITYQVEGSEQCLTEGEPNPRNQSNVMHYADIWAQKDGPELSSPDSGDIYYDEAHNTLDSPNYGKEERTIALDDHSETTSSLVNSSSPNAPFDDHENDIRQELRWLKAKYQMQLNEFRGHQLGVKQMQSSLTPNSDYLEDKEANGSSSVSTGLPQLNKQNRKPPLKFPTSAKHSKLIFRVETDKKCASLEKEILQSLEAVEKQNFTAKSFYTGSLLPNNLHRATSLPVDAIDV